MSNERVCWDCFFRERVELNGRQSTCQTRHVGAVLARGKRVVADGFNGNLPGHVHCYDGGCDRCAGAPATGVGLERCVCVHAEQNLIAYCARYGVAMDGTTAYLPVTPCLDCFKLLVSAGVAELVYATPYPASEAIVRHLAAISGVTGRNYACACDAALDAA